MIGPLTDVPLDAEMRRLGVAWGATLAWLVVSALAFFGFTGGEADLDPVRVLAVPVAVAAPVAVIWLAWALDRRLSDLGERIARVAEGPQAAGAPPDLSAIERRLDGVAAAQAALAAALDGRGRPPAAAKPPARPVQRIAAKPAETRQPRMAFGPSDEQAPLSTADLIAALQFPADAGDRAGFAALRRALADGRARGIVTSAQDVLTLLSEDGLYMDDLDPDPAPAETWRRFAHGERGAPVAEIGAIAPPEKLEPIAERLRGDTIFRDTAQHFVRLFDQTLARIEPGLTDAELAALSDTRTARAFVMVARAIGTFD